MTIETGDHGNNLQWAIILLSGAAVIVQAILNERFKRKTIKNTNAHKLRFEHEFNIYKDIWEKLNILRQELNNLKESYNNNEDKEEIFRLIKQIRITAKDFDNRLNNNLPFYSKRIFNQLEYVNELVKNDVSRIISYSSDKAAKTNLGYMLKMNYSSNAIEFAAELIRKRIAD